MEFKIDAMKIKIKALEIPFQSSFFFFYQTFFSVIAFVFHLSAKIMGKKSISTDFGCTDGSSG